MTTAYSDETEPYSILFNIAKAYRQNNGIEFDIADTNYKVQVHAITSQASMQLQSAKKGEHVTFMQLPEYHGFSLDASFNKTIGIDITSQTVSIDHNKKNWRMQYVNQQ